MGIIMITGGRPVGLVRLPPCLFDTNMARLWSARGGDLIDLLIARPSLAFQVCAARHISNGLMY